MDNNQILKILGERLEYYKKHSFFTLEDIAKKMDYSTSSIWQILNGKVDISVSKLYAFCELFETTPNKLLGVETEIIFEHEKITEIEQEIIKVLQQLPVTKKIDVLMKAYEVLKEFRS